MTKKGYWVAMVDIADQEGYKEYIALNKAAFDKYGAKFVVRAGKSEIMEGPAANRLAVIEFADFDTAMACYKAPAQSGLSTVPQCVRSMALPASVNWR
jgi:uncharacterized protein (DUF1330 family)